MLKIKVNKDKIIEYKQENGQIFIDDQPFSIDIKSLSNNQFHILKDHKSYNAELIHYDAELKLVTLKIEGHKLVLEVKNRMDILLEKMGINQAVTTKIENIKAPMPGLIIDIKVAEGEKVEKDQAIMILEAMKMENILKSPQNGIIKNIKVKKGQSVEKNQVLIDFDFES
jgi:biotin carboxyl carrier protein